jgi:1,4-dihydroxy-2-naphthoate octaprenyltransferase
MDGVVFVEQQHRAGPERARSRWRRSGRRGPAPTTLALMSRGLGEAAVALAWWLVVLGADYTQRGHFSVITAATAVSLALLLANILLINGFPDAEPDARVGKRTLVVRLGPIPAAGFYLGLALLAHGWLATSVWLLITPRAAMWGLVSLPLSLAAAGLLWRHAAAPQRLRPAIALTIAAASLHGLAMAAGLASRWPGDKAKVRLLF